MAAAPKTDLHLEIAHVLFIDIVGYSKSSWSTSITSCTVHYVDAGVDSGEIIAQREVPIVPNDTPETLHARIQVTERELYPEVIRRLSLTTDRN